MGEKRDEIPSARDSMTKDELLPAFGDAYERVIAAALAVARRGPAGADGQWGPREIVAHLAGWEVMATVRLPHIVAGMAPLEDADEARQEVMNDAINATIVTMIGDQSLEDVCALLRRAYQRDIAFLTTLDDQFFQPGNYVYERTKDVIEHCQEHLQDIHAPNR